MHTGARASIVTWRVWGARHVLMCSESGIHQPWHCTGVDLTPCALSSWWTDCRHLARLGVGWIGMTSVYLEQSDGHSQWLVSPFPHSPEPVLTPTVSPSLTGPSVVTLLPVSSCTALWAVSCGLPKLG